MKAIGILLIFGVFLASAEKARFDFYRLYEVFAENELQIEVFRQIYEYPDGYRFMAEPPTTLYNVEQLIVPPHKFGEWSELMEKFSLNAKLITENLQEMFDKEKAQSHKRKTFDWTNFQKLEDIYIWLRSLASQRPADVSTFIAGTSYEGREILGLKINIGNVVGKKSIFFEANIHANEWIGGSTQTFIINELLTSTDTNVRELLNRFEWWFIPILNVDGYVYTWEVDRTWRKTRGSTTNLLCRGADPNRNWNVNWGQYGSSLNPCSNGYHGDFAFSEPETRQLAEFMNTIPNLFGYISFHSYGQLLMLPYAYTSNFSVDHQLLLDIGQSAIQNLATIRARQYRLGTINDFFGNVAGSSVDYIAINNSPKIVYCYELNNNHILPPEEVQATGRELFISVMTIFRESVDRGLA